MICWGKLGTLEIFWSWLATIFTSLLRFSPTGGFWITHSIIQVIKSLDVIMLCGYNITMLGCKIYNGNIGIVRSKEENSTISQVWTTEIFLSTEIFMFPRTYPWLHEWREKSSILMWVKCWANKYFYDQNFMSFTLSVQFSTDCVDVEFIYSVISL